MRQRGDAAAQVGGGAVDKSRRGEAGDARRAGVIARGRSLAVVIAAHAGGVAEGRAVLRPLRDLSAGRPTTRSRAGPARDTVAAVPPVVLGELAMDPLDPVPFHLAHELLDRLTPDTNNDVRAKVGPASGRGETVTILQFQQRWSAGP
jgi:hypothetical protein